MFQGVHIHTFVLTLVYSVELSRGLDINFVKRDGFDAPFQLWKWEITQPKIQISMVKVKIWLKLNQQKVEKNRELKIRRIVEIRTDKENDL